MGFSLPMRRGGRKRPLPGKKLVLTRTIPTLSWHDAKKLIEAAGWEWRSGMKRGLVNEIG